MAACQPGKLTCATTEVITQVASALVAREMHGLVHRDLKPANLMLVHGPELTIKVIDFGLAKAAAHAGNETHITHEGFVGTPSFASPEQFNDTRVDVRSDLYSLGITLWVMLTGQTPFRGTAVEGDGSASARTITARSAGSCSTASRRSA
jgi:serine/threonine protein kinase